MQSSDIKSVGFDKESRVLEVEFKSGAVYQYVNVPENIYQEFISSDSLGRYLNTEIRDNYKGYKVEY